jgi:uncharacterized protein YidB (DUF937 family)
MDLSQIMKLANDPTVQKLLQSLLSRFAGGQGGQAAGMTGLMTQLEQHGLGNQVQSWTGTGGNEKVTGQQLTEALGADTIDQAATAAGTSPDDAANKLASVLPQLVDKASPEGSMPDPKTLQDALGQLFGPKSGSAR